MINDQTMTKILIIKLPKRFGHLKIVQYQNKVRYWTTLNHVLLWFRMSNWDLFEN